MGELDPPIVYYLKLDGSNANIDIDIGSYDFTSGATLYSNEVDTNKIYLNDVDISGDGGCDEIGYKDGETVYEILDDIIHHDVIDAITVTDEGGINISWDSGEIYDIIADAILETDANGSTACTDNAINYLYYDQTGGGTALTLSSTAPDDQYDILVATINVADGDIYELNHKPIYNEEIPALIDAFRDIFPSIVANGLVVSEHTGDNAFDVDMTAGLYYVAAYGKESVTAQDSTTDQLIRWYKSNVGEWTAVTGQTEIDTTQWNDGNALVAVNAAKYYKSLFFVTDDGINWLYPTAEYTTVAQAIVSSSPSLPSGLTDHPRSTEVVLRGNDAAFPTAGGERWIDVRPIVGGEISGQISDHGNLAGLSDDDHTQYILHSLADAANDFLVASGADTFVKKTLAETGVILEADINHDNLVDFVANEHIDHTGVTLTAGDGLTGGGDISANRSFVVDQAYNYQWTGTHQFDSYATFNSTVTVNSYLCFGDYKRKMIGSTGQIKLEVYDGLSNQFVVDISGERLLSFIKGFSSQGSIKVNEDLGNFDLIVYGETTSDQIIRTDASLHRVGIMDSYPDYTLDVGGDIHADATITGDSSATFIGHVTRGGFFQSVASVAGTYTGTGSESISFGLETRKDTSYYTHSNDIDSSPEEITIEHTGWYRFSYAISWDNDLANRSCMKAWVSDDGAAITPSHSYCYLRYNTYGKYESNVATFIAEITAGSVIKLCVDGQSNVGAFGASACDCDTIANQVWLLIERI